MSKRPKGISLFLILAFCIGMMAFSPIALAAEPQQQFVAPRLVVNSSFLNVRSGPGIQYSVLLTVVGGTELPVLGRASDNVWFQVSTVIGVGWVNIQYTVPRGNFENVPVIQLSDFIATAVQSTPITLGLPLGQGGGGPAPEVAASTVPTTASGTIRVTLSNNRVTTVSLNERFRAVINVEAVNLRTQPVDGSPTLGTVYRDDSNDYSILGSSKDNKTGIEWVAIEVPDVGVGWIEAAKIFFRLSRAAGTVMQVAATLINMTDSPGGSGDNMPVLQSGAEAFLRDISRDGKFVQIELGDGTKGWVPFDAVVTRSGTPTDEIDFEQLVGSIPTTFVQPGSTTTTSTTGAFPATFGLDTPHIVINTGFLNVRSGPGAQFSIVTTLSGGTELPVIGIATDNVWYLVEGPFGRGWVNNEFVVFRGAIQAVPIIHDTAAVSTGTLAAPVAVVAGSVTLYAAPGTNFGAIGVLNGPIEVPIVARTSDSLWIQLNTSVGFGWVVANQVIVRGDGNLIPVVG